MSDKQELTPEEIQELENIMNEITSEAKNVVEDYVKTPTDFDSGSAFQVHIDSPYLETKANDEILFKDKQWEKVVKPGLPIPPTEKTLKGVKKSKKSSKIGKKGKK